MASQVNLLYPKLQCLCRGGQVRPLLPRRAGQVSELEPQPRDWDVLLTAETHNFPCAVAPYPG